MVDEVEGHGGGNIISWRWKHYGGAGNIFFIHMKNWCCHVPFFLTGEAKARAQQMDEELVLTASLQQNMMQLGHVRTYAGVIAGAVAGLVK